METLSDTITLSDEQARVALAYLGQNDFADMLKAGLVDKVMTRKIIKANGPGTDDATLRAEAPHLYEHEVPAGERAALLGAFVLASRTEEGAELNYIVEELGVQRVQEIAEASAEMLVGTK